MDSNYAFHLLRDETWSGGLTAPELTVVYILTAMRMLMEDAR